ncbi:MAG: ribbon-helix-helix protein, CopG family [Thermoplasmata archaeon]|nr:ribbon-helix-helix protein, CopG family [Thermoplasmata archaeon]
MSDDIVTVSAKVPKQLRDRIDEIREELEISNRSVLVRRALISFVKRHVSVGIPHVEFDIEEEGKEVSVGGRHLIHRRKRRFPAKIRRKARRKSHERRD